MNTPNLGHKVRPEQPDERDAVHIAVMTVEACERLNPGVHVGLRADGKAGMARAVGSKLIGIVDPFLPKGVESGERFWLFLYPGTITSLRHVWVHPNVPDAPGTSHAVERAQGIVKRRIEAFAEKLGISYEALMEAADQYVATGEYGNVYGLEIYDISETEWMTFWRDYAALTGKIPDMGSDSIFFRCTC